MPPRGVHTLSIKASACSNVQQVQKLCLQLMYADISNHRPSVSFPPSFVHFKWCECLRQAKKKTSAFTTHCSLCAKLFGTKKNKTSQAKNTLCSWQLESLLLCTSECLGKAKVEVVSNIIADLRGVEVESRAAAWQSHLPAKLAVPHSAWQEPPRQWDTPPQKWQW